MKSALSLPRKPSRLTVRDINLVFTIKLGPIDISMMTVVRFHSDSREIQLILNFILKAILHIVRLFELKQSKIGYS